MNVLHLLLPEGDSMGLRYWSTRLLSGTKFSEAL